MINSSIPSQFIDEVRAKNDIVDIASKYMTLSRRGGNFWACCPFHNEKTPSFSIKQDWQIYKCFGCGESGNVFNLIMKLENVDFHTAVEMLAKNAGLEMPNEKDNIVMQKQKRQRERIFQVLKATTEFYHNNLSNFKDSEQRKYLDKRKISPEMIEKFQIGASFNFNDLPKYLQKLGFSAEEMLSAGVVGRNERGNLYDFYAERLIFPMSNGFGDVVAYSGRAVDDRTDRAKYKNTPQTLVFNKSEILYGYNFLRDLKKEHLLDTVIIVEGHIDVIACHQAGITNTIGSMGTALTTQHAKRIRQLADNVILCLDADKAGNKATYNGIDELRKIGLNVKVVRLDINIAKDPDEFLKKRTKDDFMELLNKAKDCIDFVLEDSAKKYNMDINSDKNRYINESLKYISTLSTPSEEDIYLRKVQQITKVPFDVLKRTFEMISADSVRPTNKEPEEKQHNETESNNYILESKIMLLASLLHKKIKNIDELSGLFDSNDELSALYGFLKEKIEKNEDYNVSMLYDNFDIKENSPIDMVINYKFPIDEVYSKYLADTIKRVKLFEMDKTLSDIREKMLSSTTTEERLDYLKKYKELQDMINKEKTNR